MHCRKARLSLENNEPLDDELMAHLRDCPSCAGFAEAQRLLDGAFAVSRNEREADPTPLSVVRAKVAMRQHRKESSIMARFAETLLGHRRWAMGIGLGVLALIFFVAVPFPYQRTVGYSVAINGAPGNIADGDLGKAMAALGYEQAPVRVLATGAGFDYQISNLPDMKAAREVGAAIVSLAGATGAPQITPIVETVSASLFAQARERKVTIEVDGEGKTDDQIKAEIESKLAAQGLAPAFVFVKTDPDGKRNIRLEIAEEGDSAKGGPQTTIEIDGRGKTDAEIEAEVKAKLAEQGRPNANVSVERTGPDSLRQIRIEIEDTMGH
jgi:hypothetical protein